MTARSPFGRVGKLGGQGGNSFTITVSLCLLVSDGPV
jgi:hypothetical protein